MYGHPAAAKDETVQCVLYTVLVNGNRHVSPIGNRPSPFQYHPIAKSSYLPYPILHHHLYFTNAVIFKLF